MENNSAYYEECKVQHEKLDILYEDVHIIVINKPSGMLSVPYPGGKARTAIGVLGRMMRKRGTFSKSHHPYVVHRLDRDTSGIMMFALTEYMQKTLMSTWQVAVTERLYRAVSENPRFNGEDIPDEGLIDSPLAYNAHNISFVPREGAMPSDRAYKIDMTAKNKSIYAKHLDFSDGKAKFKTVEARTYYKIIERGLTHTLFELSLDTGRKNQIRAHLASKNYTVAGDENYRARTDPFHRLALHARTLEFIHPATRKKMRFEVSEPDYWLEYVKQGDKYPAQPSWWIEWRTRKALENNFNK